MAVRKLVDKVYSVGAIDWDRRLFDELIPLPDGTSYNSYIIFGSEKTALIDTVEPEKKDELLTNLEKLGVKRIDYIIANHAEQDHSGSIPFVLNKFPEAKVVTNEKCKGFLKEFLLLKDDQFIVINDGDTLSLGDKTLKFIFTPWVHWPETMSTYLIEDKVLFSCDFFGSHRAASHLFVENAHRVIVDAKRYYAEIMMPFRLQIRKNIDKVLENEIKYIAPSHGPVYNDPKIIIDAYKEWISDSVEKKVLIPYISMHGSTKEIVEYLTDKFIDLGIEVIPINLTTADVGQIAMELVDAGGIIFATPYVLSGAHPSVVSTAYFINALRPKTKVVSVVASYGWGGIGVNQIKDMVKNLKVDFVEPVLIKGYPKHADFDKLDDFVEQFANKLKEKIS
jgi:flavorubredoxin